MLHTTHLNDDDIRYNAQTTLQPYDSWLVNVQCYRVCAEDY